MQAEIEEVLLLQEEWSAENTDPMRRRGELIRQVIPGQIGEVVSGLRTLDSTLEDLMVEGRDGTGLKTEIPWTRIYSSSRAPSATQGWYIAQLFSAFGDRVYLSLNQGTTRWEGGEFKPRPPAELAARVEWARQLLKIEEASVSFDISLEARRSSLGRQYELGNVASFVYDLDAIPSDAQLGADMRRMAEWLAVIYNSDEKALYVPGDPPAEIADALVAVGQAAGSNRRGAQGYRLNTAEKLAIEKHAVKVVTEFYMAQGFRVRDVGATHPFDLDIKRGEEHLSVEVKGTTSPGAQVILTSGEVIHHRDRHPANALAVVHSIQLDRGAETPVAFGGTLHIVSPWDIDEGDLSPIAFKYTTGL